MPDKFPQGANAKVGGPMHPTHPPWLALWGIVALQTLAHSIGGLGQALDATYCGLLLKWPMVNLPAPHPWGCAQAFQLGNQARAGRRVVFIHQGHGWASLIDRGDFDFLAFGPNGGQFVAKNGSFSIGMRKNGQEKDLFFLF